MKIFISGPITGFENYKENFNNAQKYLEEKGHIVLNPAVLPPGMTTDDYMILGLSMLSRADAVYFLRDWGYSTGAGIEYDYARYSGKLMFYQEENLI